MYIYEKVVICKLDERKINELMITIIIPNVSEEKEFI